MQGGEISFSSELGKGSNFGFRIPIEIGSKEKLAKSEEKEILKFEDEGLKILIAEDNPINLVYITGVLEKYNFTFKTVTNGQEAVDALRDSPEYNAVFMDLQMPEVDGYEATKIIREDLKLQLPIIALTANAFPEDKRKVKKAGMNGFISKPFEPNDLFRELKRVLDIGSSIPEKESTISTVKSDTNVISEESESLEEQQTNTESYYSLAQIEKLSAGNSDFLEKMINVFLEETPLQIKQMKEMMERNDFYKVGRLAHKMKPTIDMFDMLDLKVVIRELESESKNKIIETNSFKEKVNFTIDRLNLILKDVDELYRN
jgi:CheY-like chemotaxis protein